MEFPPLMRQRALVEAISRRAYDLQVNPIELFVYIGLSSDNARHILNARATPDDFDALCRLCYYLGILEAHPTFLFGIDPTKVEAWLNASIDEVVKRTSHFADGVMLQFPEAPKRRRQDMAVVTVCIVVAILLYPLNAFELNVLALVIALVCVVGIGAVYVWKLVEAYRYGTDNWNYNAFVQDWWREHEQTAAPPAMAEGV